MAPAVLCWNLLRRALGAAHFAQEEMSVLRAHYSEAERRAIAKVIEHLEQAIQDLRPTPSRSACARGVAARR